MCKNYFLTFFHIEYNDCNQPVFNSVFVVIKYVKYLLCVHRINSEQYLEPNSVFFSLVIQLQYVTGESSLYIFKTNRGAIYFWLNLFYYTYTELKLKLNTYKTIQQTKYVLFYIELMQQNNEMLLLCYTTRMPYLKYISILSILLKQTFTHKLFGFSVGV